VSSLLARLGGGNEWRLTAWVAGVFAVLLGLGMAAGYLHAGRTDPIDAPRLKALKLELQSPAPGRGPSKQQIRALDLVLRETYFTRLSRTSTGLYLLLGAVTLFLIANGRIANGRKRLPVLKAGVPGLPPPENKGWSRWAVAGTGAALAVFLFLLSLGFTSALPGDAEALEALFGPAPTDAPVMDAASPEEMRQNWPRLFGANAGLAFSSQAPSSWDTNSGAGIAWKVPAPAPGFNSPIVWGDRAYFSGGPPEKLEVLCVNLADGQVAWRQTVADVAGTPKGDLEIPESTGYTAPTMATDGRRVYAIFANGNVAAYSLDGSHVWTKAFGALGNPYGHAISLATWQDRLVVQLDQGDSEDGKSKLYLLNGRTGEIVWQKPRKVGASWTTPVVFEAADKSQVAALAVPWVISYDLKDGSELWRVDCLNGEVTPSPIFVGGLLLITSPSDRVVAIRPDGQGDVTKTHMAWENDDNVPDVTTPASNGELMFSVTTGGTLTCLEVKTGTKVWEHEMDMDYHASPTISGNRVYLFSQSGVAVIVEAGREFKELFRTGMGDSFHATPAFTADHRMVVRGMSYLWCLKGAANEVQSP